MANKEERLNNSEFIELIPHLPLEDLLRVEFKIDKWGPFVQVKDAAKIMYGCCVCGVVQSGVKNLYAHVDGKKHKLKMRSVKQLYHPEYTYPKTEAKLAAKTSIQKTSTSKIAQVSTSTKAANNKNVVQKQNTLNTTNSKNAITKKVIAKASECSKEIEQQIKDENKLQPAEYTSDEKILSTTQSNVSKESNIVNQSHSTDKKETNSTGSNEKTLPLSNDAQNKLKININEETVATEKELEGQNRADTAVDNLKSNSNDTNKANVSLNNNNSNLTKLIKNPLHGRKPMKQDTIQVENDSAVIIIDDDASDNSKQTEEPPLKKLKTVLNPAAVSREKEVVPNIESKKNDKDVEKPKYQTNVIIIPTVVKNRNVGSAVSKSNVRDQPKFATKTFSCNPRDDDVHGLLGVEYVIKILKNRGDQQPKYECSLCELVLDGCTMQNHLIGYSHRLKFCEKHFPTAIRQYRQYMSSIPQHEIFKVMTPVLAKLAVAIEQHHGRDLPYECLERDFNINRHDILSKVFSCRHASEQYGPTFTHVVDSKEIDRLIAARNSYKPETFSKSITFDNRPGTISRRKKSPEAYKPPQRNISADVHYPFPNLQYTYNQFEMNCPTNSLYTQQLDDNTHKLMVDDFLRNTTRNRRTTRFRSRSRSSSPPLRSGISRSNIIEKRKSLSPLRQNDIWQAYRHLVDQKVSELDEVFKIYKDDPEMHPSYNNEWEMFWKRRKEELIAAGLDHRTYNYQPEWVRFFNIRIEELYNEAVENVKIESRRRLCLPMTNYELTDPKYHVHVSESININVNSIAPAAKTKQKQADLRDQNKPELVSVLRLLTALEEYLGSLGPKIIDLLSKALQIEKTNPEKINSIVLTNETCALLETAMEKFKGLIITGILEGPKVRALKKAIEGVETLLSHAVDEKEMAVNKNALYPSQNKGTTFREQLPHTSFNKHATSNTTTSLKGNSEDIANNKKLLNNILAQVDKKELAAKLAALLTAQGKTNVDSEQLQKILSVYMLIEKKKRETPFDSDAMATTESSENQRALRNTLTNLINASESKSEVSFQDNSRGTINVLPNQGVPTNNRYTAGTSHWQGTSFNENVNIPSKTLNSGAQSFMGFSGNCMNLNPFPSNSGSYNMNVSRIFGNTPNSSYTLGNGNSNFSNAVQRPDNIFIPGNQQQRSNIQQNNQQGFNRNYNVLESSRGDIIPRQDGTNYTGSNKIWSGNNWRKL